MQRKVEWYIVATLSRNSRWQPQTCTQDQIFSSSYLLGEVTICNVKISLSLSLKNSPLMAPQTLVRMPCPKSHVSYHCHKLLEEEIKHKL
jgi:hypothetical protein